MPNERPLILISCEDEPLKTVLSDALTETARLAFVRHQDTDFKEKLVQAKALLMDMETPLSALEDAPASLQIALIGDRLPAKQRIDHFFKTPVRLGEIVDFFAAIVEKRQLSRHLPKTLQFGPITFEPMRLTMSDNAGHEILLTEKERDVVLALYQAADKTMSREALLEEVWGYAVDAETHTVETHLYRLRQKLAKLKGGAEFIATTESGYRLQ